jgi:tRNA1(Val) A37 N6-methylase TrmN6/superfamily II DNA/RNA helicase
MLTQLEEQISNSLLGYLNGGNIDSKSNNIAEIIKQNPKINDAYKELGKLSQEELLQKIIETEKKNEKLQQDLKEQTKLNEGLLDKGDGEEGTKKKKKVAEPKDIDIYTILNIHRFLRTQEGLKYNPDDNKRTKNDDGEDLINPLTYQYDEFESLYDKNYDKYRDYQRNFIKNWTLSTSELVIAYYGTGTGKTFIAISCMDEYIRLNPDGLVYLIMPTSLVFNAILECFNKGIDPTRKNSNGDYIYNFVSYQQMLRSKYEFKDNSLLIIDEIHNLRNIKSRDINERVSAMKWKPTGNYQLSGSILAKELLTNTSNLTRKIFLTGTLFVNGSEDLEGIISIGYNKKPLLNTDTNEYNVIMENDDAFKKYYQGLISFYRIEGVNKTMMPKTKYEFIKLEDETLNIKKYAPKEDAYYINSRTDGNKVKMEWLINFLKNNKDQKTLIYTQFVGKSLNNITKELDKQKIIYGEITGKLSNSQKLEVISKYNNNEIKVLLFTLSIKEGISFKETDNMIIFQPYWNYAILEQVIARAIRLNSHAKGDKSLVNIYHLVAVPKFKSIFDDNIGNNKESNLKDKKKSDSEINKWFKNANSYMNNDIKTLKLIKPVGSKVKEDIFGSRDIDLYNRMFDKQSEINIFEERLLKLPRFEDYEGIENNEFVKYYNKSLMDYQSSNGKAMKLKDQFKLKKEIYKQFYNKDIEELNKRITKITDDSTFKEQATRNPNLEEEMNIDKYPDLEKKIETIINKGGGLKEIFKAFNIDKTVIFKYQANFTPESQVDYLIKLMKINENNKEKLMILEPTAGVGAMIKGLLKLDNKQNFFIDANEINGIFYQTGKTFYKNINNIKWYNLDFFKFNSRYNYDYIIGNPPFNLRISKINEKSKAKKKVMIDINIYDVNFVEIAYNMLIDGGKLGFIISNRFQHDNNEQFKTFRLYLEELKKYDAVIIENYKEGFKKDKNITKEQETGTSMVYIILTKIKDFSIDLDDPEGAKVMNKEDKLKRIEEIKKIKKENKNKAKEINKEKKSKAKEDKLGGNIRHLINTFLFKQTIK